MSSSPSQLGRDAGLWDIPSIIYGAQALQKGYSGSFPLSPTALLPAVWLLTSQNTSSALVWEITFSTDTAISWQLVKAPFGYVTTVRTITDLTPGGAASDSSWMAAVVAGPVTPPILLAGFAAANSYTAILGKGWLMASGGNLNLALVTGLVAAKCHVSFHWTELAVG